MWWSYMPTLNLLRETMLCIQGNHKKVCQNVTFALSTLRCNIKQVPAYPNTLAKSHFYCIQGVKCKTG